MLQNIKNTIQHTAVYGFGNLATKIIGIVLLPLYTSHLTVADYGVLGIIEITLMIATQFFMLGQGNTLLRFYHLPEYSHQRPKTLFTLFAFLLSIIAFFSAVGWYLVGQVSHYFQESTLFALYFKISIGIIFLRVLTLFMLNDLRAREKSVMYAGTNLLKLVVILFFNIYFVAYLRIGVTGILYAYLIGEMIMLLMLLPLVLPQMVPRIDIPILKAAIAFGFPLIFSSLASVLLNVGDRYLLKIMVNYQEVGLYNLGYKIGGILNVFLIQSFSLGLLPIAYKLFGQQGDRRFYSKIMTYFVFVLAWAGLALCFYNTEVIRFFAKSPAYWPASTIVPLIVLAYVFAGANYVATIGIYLTRQTKYSAIVNGVGLAVNITANLLLIPKYHMMGAAWATLIAFAVMYGISYFFSQQLYKIPYENGKLMKILGLGLALYFISSISLSNVQILQITYKFLLLLSFPFILYLLNFYERIELARLKSFFKKTICFLTAEK